MMGAMVIQDIQLLGKRMSSIPQPHPEERALARVSKDGCTARTSCHPSRRGLRPLLRMRRRVPLTVVETAVRQAKNVAESDRIRDELLAMGVVLKDSKDGTTWEIAR